MTIIKPCAIVKNVSKALTLFEKTPHRFSNFCGALYTSFFGLWHFLHTFEQFLDHAPAFSHTFCADS